MNRQDHFLELIRRAASDLPQDVTRALEQGRDAEPEGSAGRAALEEVLRNCEVARELSRPLCQDTGTNIWFVYHPPGTSQTELTDEILAATREATEKSFLRANAVDSITGKNSGDNTGLGFPVIHFHEWDKPHLQADLMLKGGGSENVSSQYALPAAALGAGRDVEGIRRAVIDGVFQAQGKGCGPGVIGVGVGGDRATSMAEAKEQLVRQLDDTNPDPELGELEQRLHKELNELGVGPMGFGGATTVLGVKVGKRHRLPASFFVSVAYMCWACRRASLCIEGDQADFSVTAEIASHYTLSDQQ
jgi:fumarate hydratase class I